MSRTARTLKKDEKFFSAIETGAPVGVAASEAGYSRRSVYDYRDSDEDFRQQWEDAKASAIERLETEADRRAAEGTLKPVFYQGVQCGQIREFSDTLLMFRLKALDPAKYRDRQSIEHSGEIKGGVLAVPGIMDPSEWERLVREESSG